MKRIIYLLPFLVCALFLTVFAACTSEKTDMSGGAADGGTLYPDPGETESYTLTYSATEGGRIEGEAVQTLKEGEDGKKVKAVPDEGAYFVEWSDGNKNPVRQDIDVTSEKDITAKFEYFEYTVTYLAGEHGHLRGKTVQKVKYGSYTQDVGAIPDDYYKFLRWSDGLEKEYRADKVTCDITLTAEFVGEERNIRFTAGNGGKIEGKLNQTVEYGDYCEEVVAVPDDGYEFAGWSNGELNTHLTLPAPRDDSEAWEFTAYFRPVEKHFDYDYGNVQVTLPQEGITLQRDNLLNTEFDIPECDGYVFWGWYADEDYKLKVADSDGRYMLGYYGFGLETDTLYARWSKESETDGKIVHKVLFAMPQEIRCTLEVRDDYYRDNGVPALSGDTLDVDYKMTAVEYIACGMIIEKFEELLNSWFANTNIRFEVDSYYTLLPILQKNMARDMNSTDYDYQLNAYNIQELADLNPRYHNVIVMEGLHDYYGYVSSVNVLGENVYPKYSNVYIDRLFFGEFSAGRPFEKAINREYQNRVPNSITGMADTCIHEFIHSCERYFTGGGAILEWHLYSSKIIDDLEAARKYLLGEAEYEGHTSKVLIEKYFVNDDFKIYAQYTGYYSDRYEVIVEPKVGVNYGDTVTAKVVPMEGWRFIEWSDGVTTAERTDKIISFSKVYPIIAERTALKITQKTVEEDGGLNKEGIGGHFIISYNGETTEAENIDMDFPEGAVVTVEAVPNVGYSFMRWDDGSHKTVVTFTVDSYINIYAVFIKERTALKIRQETTDDGESVKDSGGGYFIITYDDKTIKAENIDMDFPQGTVVTVEAVPNEGYSFMAWLDYENFIGEIHIDGSKITVKVDCFNKLGALFVNNNYFANKKLIE